MHLVMVAQENRARAGDHLHLRRCHVAPVAPHLSSSARCGRVCYPVHAVPYTPAKHFAKGMLSTR